MNLFLTIVMVMLLVMSLGAFYVHLLRSVREFRAGYQGLDQQLTA
ncbi:MAG: hypothetical protein SOR40_02490 [Rothia sp. (in: high G+C Gram-positive bacteria)]|nr:hypothetical protein [Rothia sp. (in: high G+C Gram-positive bacteria)]